ncbi:uncharacterized protein LOC143469761 isoform X2 [Clavelina lepadiformis]|uniref:uncharacterized protein LOC143469761 isoform X2 n=1 Tax=Clavelina lepadiformis TaxID=159417 RepID=UPI0040425A5C
MVSLCKGYIQVNKMSTVGPLSLYEWCRQSIAKAMFDRLINESNILWSSEMLLTFVTSKLLPRLTSLEVMRAFILALDKGHAHFTNEQEDCSNTGSEDMRWRVMISHSHTCAEVADKNQERRFRAMALSRHCTYVIMATWTEDSFSPSCLVEESFPIGLSRTMRHWLILFAVDGFLLCNDISQSAFLVNPSSQQANSFASVFLSRICSYHVLDARQTHANNAFLDNSVQQQIRNEIIKKRQRHPLKTLDLRELHENDQFITDEVINMLMWALQRRTDKNENKILPIKKEQCNLEIPSIKLGLAYMETSFDMHSNKVLSVLRESYTNGFAVDLASIRFENVCFSTVEQILQTVVNPADIRKINFYHHDPNSIFQAREGLSRLVNLEKFVLASLTSQSDKFSFTETFSMWNDIFVHWPKLRAVKISGIRMSFCDNAKGFQSNALHLPDSLITLKFAHESITAEALEWLARCYEQLNTSQSSSGKDNTSALSCLRLKCETSLTRNLELWNSFLQFFEKHLSCIRSFNFDHCNMNENQARDLINLVTSRAKCSSLRRFGIRERNVSRGSFLKIFDAVISALPDEVTNSGTIFHGTETSYFSAHVPFASDQIVPEMLRGSWMI